MNYRLAAVQILLVTGDNYVINTQCNKTYFQLICFLFIHNFTSILGKAEGIKFKESVWSMILASQNRPKHIFYIS